MANVIRYKTSQPTKRGLRRGNVVVGTGEENYGPTSTTGYVNGITPPDGGYVVYTLSGNNDPAIYVANSDDDLPTIARTLGGGELDYLAAKNYLNSRSNTWVLDNTPKNTISDGLVLNLNAKNVSSFVDNLPTTNLITNSGTSNTGWAGYGWSGGQAISNDYSNTYEFTATNGWHNRTFDTGVTSGGTIQVTFEYKLKQQETTQNQLFVLNGTHLGSYTNVIGYGSMTFEWQTFNGTFTANADSKVAIGPRGADASGLTDIVYIRNLQVEVKDDPTPFVNGTRSQNTTWKDISGNGSNATFNNGVQNTFESNKGFTFDGVDDYAQISGLTVRGQDNKSYEALIKLSSGFNAWGSIIAGRRSSTNDFAVYNDRRLRGSEDDNGVLSNTHLDVDKWYHVAYTFELNNSTASTQSLYINGKLDATGLSNSYNDTYVNSTSYLGYDARFSQYFSGSINSVKVYSKTLSSNELSQNYYGGNIVTNDLLFSIDAGNLVSYESGSTTAYSMTGSLSGTLINGINYTNFNNGAWEFDGTNEGIQFSSDFDLSGYSSLTYEGWVKGQGVTTLDRWFSGTNSTSNSGYHYPDLAMNSGGNLFYYFNSLATGWANTGTAISTTEYNHIVFTFTNNGDVELYVNGSLEYTATHSSGTFPSTTRYMIGNRYDRNGEALVGKIAIVRTYSRALIASEVLQNFNAQKSRFGL